MPIYSDSLEAYNRNVFASDDEITASIRSGIKERGLPEIMIRPEEAAFLQFLVAASGARLALEIGTLGGYSGTWIARGLPEQGKLVTLELERHHAEVAREHFQLAGVEDRVDVRVGNAHTLLPELANEGPFDFIFVDAEKAGYPAYLDWSLDNLAPGGIFTAHNAFLFGKVGEDAEQDERVQTMRTFNQQLAQDPRLTSILYPAGDGMAAGVFQR